ncbi:hypothetical protein ACTXL8_05375 [Glutamicibacter arilaitensis]|uniref:hypothetical protein n=1 Tax=Glutamicibacter arilaitensis TaxID=256701 RepID=UPI003FD2FBD6
MELTSLLISALSLLIALSSAIWAISASKGADKHAKKAGKKADTANQLSAEANFIAEDSKRIAIESREIGEEALTIARRTESRESDTSNIHWESYWQEPGIYAFTNRGDDEAFNVRIILTIDDVEIRRVYESVPGGGSVQIECPQARATYLDEVRTFEEEKRAYARRQNRSPYGLAGIEPMSIQFGYHSYRERIDWETGTGKPGHHDVEDRMSLGEFD